MSEGLSDSGVGVYSLALGEDERCGEQRVGVAPSAHLCSITLVNLREAGACFSLQQHLDSLQLNASLGGAKTRSRAVVRERKL